MLEIAESQSEGSADLEIAANDEYINAWPLVDLTSLLDGGVDSVESAMTLLLRQPSTLMVEKILTQPSIAMRMFLFVYPNHMDSQRV